MRMQLRTKDYMKYILPVLVLFVIAAATFAISLKQTRLELSDIYFHMHDAVEIVEGRLSTSYPVWYIVFGLFYKWLHFPVNYAAAAACACFAILTSAAIYLVLDRELGRNVIVNSMIVVFMSFFGPLHFRSFGDYYYLGQSSFNTWHNPTNPSVKFLAIIIFYFYIHYFHSDRHDIQNYLGIPLTKIKATILLGVLVFISLLCKPSFFQVFAPTVAVIYLLEFFVYKKRKIREYIYESALFIPAILFFIYQIIYNFFSPSSASGGIEFSFFTAWRYWTNSVFLSIMAIMTLPLFVSIFCEKNLLKNKLLLFSLVFYFVSVAEYGLLAETGDRLAHGNFGWGYSLAIGIIFLSAIITFVRYIRARSEKKAWIYWVKVIIGCNLLLVHFCRGVWYYLQLLVFRNVQLF